MNDTLTIRLTAADAANIIAIAAAMRCDKRPFPTRSAALKLALAAVAADPQRFIGQELQPTFYRSHNPLMEAADVSTR